MKVAVCFSGLVRCPNFGLESLKLISPGDDVKVFAHTWKNIHDIWDEFNQPVTDKFSYLQKFNFETLLIEDYETKKSHFQKMYDFFKFKVHEATPRTDLGIISMFYSIYQSNSLKRRYERFHNVKFDKVIRMRFDSNFESKILDLNNLNYDLSIPDDEDWCGGTNDQFSVANSQTMDLYADMYNSFSLVRHIPYHPESMFGEYLKIRNLVPHRFNFKVSISSYRSRHY